MSTQRRSAAQRNSARRGALARIHLVAKQLALDEDTYRALLERVTGKRSARVLDGRQLRAVLNELARLAGQGPRRPAGAELADAPKSVPTELAAMVGKVGAILVDAGREWSYAHGVAKRMFNVARVEWLNADQLRRLVAALSIDQQRRRKRAGGTS